VVVPAAGAEDRRRFGEVVARGIAVRGRAVRPAAAATARLKVSGPLPVEIKQSEGLPLDGRQRYRVEPGTQFEATLELRRADGSVVNTWNFAEKRLGTDTEAVEKVRENLFYRLTAEWGKPGSLDPAPEKVFTCTMPIDELFPCVRRD
jgi:hypothetical protein